VIIEPNVPWLLEGGSDDEAALTWWRVENDRVQREAGGDTALRARLWFELGNNRGPGTFEAQAAPLRRMWLDNFDARRSGGPPPPLTCEQFGTISTPTLVVGADHGMPYSRRIVDRLAGCIRGSQQVVVPGVTHFMSYQAPDVFNDVVLEFIARH